MLEIIGWGLLFLLALMGVVSLVYLLMVRLHRKGAEARFIVVLPCGVTEREIPSLLCAARLRNGLMGDITHAEVIALDCGLPEAVRRQCEALCREMDHTRLCSPEELTALLRRQNGQDCP